MKLLFDQNLSPRLTTRLADLFPGSMHVCDIELDRVSDMELWTYARQNSYTIVSKDSDFNEISLQHGFPPNVIWIKRGNCSTTDIEQILRNQYEHIEELIQSTNAGILLLY